MLTRKHSIQGKSPFANTADLFETLDGERAMKFAMIAGDITLVLNDAGTILDTAVAPDQFPDFSNWQGENWLDTVTEESRVKVMEMLAAARRGEVQHWRQVNHPTAQGDMPIRYVVLSIDDGKHRIAFGRDLRETGRMQQRLLQVQQSLERDYMRMRQLEARYRMLFESSSEATLIVEAATLRIRESNPAANILFGVKDGGLAGKKVPALLARGSRDAFQALAAAAQASDTPLPTTIEIAHEGHQVTASAAGFTQDRSRFLLVRLSAGADSAASNDNARTPIVELIDAMPDAFVVTNETLEIVEANAAFVELVHSASSEQLRGRDLATWVGRPGIDLDLIEGQIEQHGAARNVSTVVRAGDQFEEEPVELSAVRSTGSEALRAFVIRPIGRRVRDLPPAGSQNLPRSVEQLTDLVGRMSLKEIVRESTDLIERLCIEAALTYTSDNRASAAEILGLSRQSLYSKLHRHGLGNLTNDTDS